VIANISLDLLEIVEHLLATSLCKASFAADFWVVDIRHARRLNFVLLVMHLVGQADSLASLLSVFFLPLLD